MLVSEIICNFAFEKIKLFKQLETKLYTMKQEDKSSLKNTLYAQMHKQYLENDSSKTSTIHYYIGAIAFIFSAYGYVYSYPYLHPCVCLDASYSPLIIGITIFSYLILSLLAILAVNIGYCSRKEHNRIYQIFDKAGSSFFTRKNKTKIRLSNFLPDYYGILFVFFNIFIVLLCIASCKHTLINKNCCTDSYFLIGSCAFVVIINIMVYIYYYYKLKNQTKIIII